MKVVEWQEERNEVGEGGGGSGETFMKQQDEACIFLGGRRGGAGS